MAAKHRTATRRKAPPRGGGEPPSCGGETTAHCPGRQGRRSGCAGRQWCGPSRTRETVFGFGLAPQIFRFALLLEISWFSLLLFLLLLSLAPVSLAPSPRTRRKYRRWV